MNYIEIPLEDGQELSPTTSEAIEKALQNLHRALENIGELPEDFSDWNNADWIIYALQQLTENTNEII